MAVQSRITQEDLETFDIVVCVPAVRNLLQELLIRCCLTWPAGPKTLLDLPQCSALCLCHRATGPIICAPSAHPTTSLFTVLCLPGGALNTALRLVLHG